MHKMPRWYREEMNRTEILPCGLTCVKINMRRAERIEAMLINKIELKIENVRPPKKKKNQI